MSLIIKRRIRYLIVGNMLMILSLYFSNDGKENEYIRILIGIVKKEVSQQMRVVSMITIILSFFFKLTLDDNNNNHS